MYNPTREQARQFFIDAWRKQRERLPLTQLEVIAADLVQHHPEYQAVIEDPDSALDRDWTPEMGQTNPFLHLSLHLAIEEHLSIDQPHGLRAAFETLLARRGDRHDALHDVLECLGETMWRAQKSQSPPDGEAYVECVRRKAG
jgi:hypothetical protein